jgi:hypothetical protein
LGEITNAYALGAEVMAYGGIITNAYGLYVHPIYKAAEASIVNNYGVYICDQSGIGSTLNYNLYSAGATAKNKIEGILEFGSGTAPSAAVDTVKMWGADANGEVGKATVYFRPENTDSLIAVGAFIKTDTGDPAAANSYEGMIVINTFDNKCKIYAEAAWRQIATW